MDTKEIKDVSETDIAYEILIRAERDRPIFYRDLIQRVIEQKGKDIYDRTETISEIYTMINLDSRFQYFGEGNWGLSDWEQPKPKRKPKATSKKKTK